jgi:hypothetical protein
MKKTVHPVIGYTAIIIGAVFLASAIFVIAKVGAPNIIWNQSFSKAASHKPAEEKVATIKDDIVNKSALFSDSELAPKINVTPEHFSFNEILSHSENKIVYAELTKCPDETGYSDCPWNYSIKIFDANKNITATVFTQNNNKALNSYGQGIIYYPTAWSKNDKKIILAWYNLYAGGQGFAPPRYSLLDQNGGKIENPGAFVDCNANLFDTNTQAITATDKNGGVLCSEGDAVTTEQIIVTNAETGKTMTIVGKENGIGHAIKSFDPLTRTLVYTTFPCKETNQTCERAEGGEVTTKQIKVITQ